MTQRKIQYWVIPPKENPQFAANMENVLAVYKQPYDQRFPIVCMDEQPVQLLEEVNRPLEEWGKLIGDVPSATAILDRFLHHIEVVQITGRSYRMGNSGKSSNSTKAPTGSVTEEA